jgi:CRP-like cAMP-binding protein
MTQEQIGDATGLTAVHVNRTLQAMRSDGLISGNRQSVTITDWPKLQAAGDFNRAYLH